MTWNRIESRPRDPQGRIAPAPRQGDVLQAIGRLTQQQGYPPTIRELVDAMGYATPNAVAQHLRLLRRKGWVIWETGKSRTLRVVNT